MGRSSKFHFFCFEWLGLIQNSAQAEFSHVSVQKIHCQSLETKQTISSARYQCSVVRLLGACLDSIRRIVKAPACFPTCYCFDSCFPLSLSPGDNERDSNVHQTRAAVEIPGIGFADEAKLVSVERETLDHSRTDVVEQASKRSRHH